METLDQVSATHDWDRGNELWVCKRCKLTPISAHIWGDDHWTADPISCEEEMARQKRIAGGFASLIDGFTKYLEEDK